MHPDPRVRDALIKLTDALCSYERNTGRNSVLILREKNYVFRAVDGKPGIPDDIPDDRLMEINL